MARISELTELLNEAIVDTYYNENKHFYTDLTKESIKKRDFDVKLNSVLLNNIVAKLTPLIIQELKEELDDIKREKIYLEEKLDNGKLNGDDLRDTHGDLKYLDERKVKLADEVCALEATLNSILSSTKGENHERSTR